MRTDCQWPQHLLLWVKPYIFCHIRKGTGVTDINCGSEPQPEAAASSIISTTLSKIIIWIDFIHLCCQWRLFVFFNWFNKSLLGNGFHRRKLPIYSTFIIIIFVNVFKDADSALRQERSKETTFNSPLIKVWLFNWHCISHSWRSLW